MGQLQVELAGSGLAPLGWATLVAQVRRTVPAATLVLASGRLHVVLDGTGAVPARMPDLVAALVRACAAAGVSGQVRVAGARAVGPGDGPADEGDADPRADVAGVARLQRLLAYDLYAAVSGWAGSPGAAALLLAQAFDARAVIVHQGLLASHLLGELALAGTPLDAGQVQVLAEARAVPGQWPLLLPSLAEALVAGAVDDAFDPGERVHVPTVAVAVLMVTAALADRLAAVRGCAPAELVERLLLGRPG